MEQQNSNMTDNMSMVPWVNFMNTIEQVRYIYVLCKNVFDGKKLEYRL